MVDRVRAWLGKELEEEQGREEDGDEEKEILHIPSCTVACCSISDLKCSFGGLAFPLGCGRGNPIPKSSFLTCKLTTFLIRCVHTPHIIFIHWSLALSVMFAFVSFSA